MRLVKALPVIQKFADSNIFLFSNFTGAQPQREPPNDKYVYNVRASYRQETAKLVDYLVSNGKKRIALFIQFDAYGRSGADGTERQLKTHSLTPVAETTYERGIPYSTKLTDQVNKIIASNADAVISIGSYAASAAFIRDARNSGFTGPIANVSFVGPDALLTLLLEEETKAQKNYTHNLINSQVVPPWNDLSFSIVVEYQKMMKKHTPLAPPLTPPGYEQPLLGFGSLEGFMNAKLFGIALKKTGKNLTRAHFRSTLESISSLNIGLGTKNHVNFSPTRHQALDTVFLTTVKSKNYVLINPQEPASR